MNDTSESASAFAPLPPDPELKRLEPLLGSWTTGEHTQDSVLGPGVSVTSNERFYWLDGGYFLVSTYETMFGNDPAQKGIMYWGYDSATGKFRTLFFSNNGPFTEEGSRYEGQVADGKLIFIGPARFEYALNDDGKIKTNRDGTVSVVWWLRDEDAKWKPWMSNTFTRKAD